MSVRTELRKIIEEDSTFYGRVFDYVVIVLIIVSLISFSVTTIPDNSELINEILFRTNYFCIVFFTIEYLLRVWVAKKTLKYIFSFYGIIDLVSILGFYIQGALDLRGFKLFRIFRVIRILELSRYKRAVTRLKIAFNLIKEELVIITVMTFILIFLSASIIYYFENPVQPETFTSIFDSFWWAIVTLSTVGYGDSYPITVGGKIFTFFTLLIGIGIVAVPAGLFATALNKAREIEDNIHKTKPN